MLLHVLIALGLSIFIYWIAPKVIIDPQPMPIDDNTLIPPRNVQVISWNNAEFKFQNQINGPESFTHNPDTGEIYTGTSDGMIWRINKDLTNAQPLLRIGKDHRDCGLEHVEELCGRVLGLKFLSPDKLIVADSYNGIICIHLKNLHKEVLVRPDQNELTKSLKLFNSVDISKGGIIYFTVLSMNWPLKDFVYSYIEGERKGRVYSYNMKTRELNLIAKDLFWSNGIALTQNETALLVCECFLRRIITINLKNLKEKPKIFIESLPGFPDNIKKADSDNYYVALLTFRSESLISFLHQHPLLSRLAAWFVPEWLFLYTGAKNNKAFKINERAEIISIINGTDLQELFITEAYQVGNKVLLGNLHHPFVPVIDSN